MLERLRTIVERSDTPAGRRFDFAIQTLIVLSLLLFSLETLPDLSEDARRWLESLDVVIIAIFTVEYLLRVTLAKDKRRFVFSFFGLVDLFAILPFYVASGIDLRSLRACRLIRLFQAFKLIRYSRAIRRLRRALWLAREELLLFLSLTMFVLFVAATGIYYFERQAQPEAFASIFHSLWWAVATLTTVGYGDVYPVTAGGKLFTFVVLILGLALVALPSGLIASALSEARRLENEGVADREGPGMDSGQAAAGRG